MNVVAALDELDVQGAVVSIGNFDGVHLGHRKLLSRMQAVAEAEAAPSVIVTFFPPARVLFGSARYLSSAAEKVAQLAAFEPQAVVLTPFTHTFAKTPKARFLEALRPLEPSTIIVGENFRFGRAREGDLNDLSAVTGKLEVFGLWHHQGEPVSSSRIRDLLTAGEVDRAASLLGDRYRASGTVVLGDRRGQQLGYPTANLEVAIDKALPVGVFAVEVHGPAAAFLGMTNAGPKPTFPDAPPGLEVHLFDFAGDLYGAELTVTFVAYLRSQQKFSGIDELSAQLRRDEAAARSVFAARGGSA